MEEVLQSLCFFLVDCRSVVSAGYMIPPEDFLRKVAMGTKRCQNRHRGQWM